MFKLWVFHLPLQYPSGKISEHKTNYNPGPIHGINILPRITFYQNHLWGQYFMRDNIFLKSDEAILKT